MQRPVSTVLFTFRHLAGGVVCFFLEHQVVSYRTVRGYDFCCPRCGSRDAKVVNLVRSAYRAHPRGQETVWGDDD